MISGQSSVQDSDTDASSCVDTSDEETSNTIRELTQVLDDAANQDEYEAPAARQRAHQERAPAAGAGAARTNDHMAPVARQCDRKEREAAGGAGADKAEIAETSAPAARQSAHLERASAAGAGDAKIEREQAATALPRKEAEHAAGAYSKDHETRRRRQLGKDRTNLPRAPRGNEAKL